MDNVLKLPGGDVAGIGAGITVFFGTYLITGYITDFDSNQFGTWFEIKWPLLAKYPDDEHPTQSGPVWINMCNVQAYSRGIVAKYDPIVQNPAQSTDFLP